MHDSSVGTTCNERSEKRVLYYKNILVPHLQESSVEKTENESPRANSVPRKTTIKEVEDEESYSSGHFQTTETEDPIKEPIPDKSKAAKNSPQPAKKPKPFSALWVLTRLQDLAAEAGIGILKQWTHDQKQREATTTLV